MPCGAAGLGIYETQCRNSLWSSSTLALKDKGPGGFQSPRSPNHYVKFFKFFFKFPLIFSMYRPGCPLQCLHVEKAAVAMLGCKGVLVQTSACIGLILQWKSHATCSAVTTENSAAGGKEKKSPVPHSQNLASGPGQEKKKRAPSPTWQVVHTVGSQI